MTLFLTLLLAGPVPLDTPRRDTIGPAVTMATTRRSLWSRLSGAWKAVTASLRRLRLTGWDMADARTQERDLLGELPRHLTMPPLGL